MPHGQRRAVVGKRPEKLFIWLQSYTVSIRVECMHIMSKAFGRLRITSYTC